MKMIRLFRALRLGKERNGEHEQAFKDKLALLEMQLEGKKFVAADHLTIADFSIYTTLGVVNVYGFDMSPFKNISAWSERIEQLPYNKEVNTDPMVMIKETLAASKAKTAETTYATFKISR